MLKSIKIRLYPSKLQQQVFAKHFGCCRYFYNNSLAFKKELYSKDKTSISKFDLIKRLTILKQLPEHSFLSEVKAEVLQNQIDNLDSAFKTFFRKKIGFPKFKRKDTRQSFTSKQSLKVLENVNKIVFYKNKIKFKCSVKDQNLLRNQVLKKITWSKDRLNQYYASVLINSTEDLKLEPIQKVIGVDLGLTHFLVTSDKTYIENPRFLQASQEKLSRQQRKLSRKIQGSSNRAKQRISLAKIYNKITNQRDYFLQQVCNKLLNENQVLNLETLAVSDMLKNHYLAKSISDVSWSKFNAILDYKAQWKGRQINRVDRFYPSSKICSNCGCKKTDLQLSDRTFKCSSCGHTEDRDLNAAKNLRNYFKNRDELTRINAFGQQSIDTGGRKKKSKELEKVPL